MKEFVTGVRLVVLILVSLLILNSCTRPEDNAINMQDATSGEPVQITHTVEIKEMKFTPDVILARRGEKVIFINHDLLTHDITEDPGKAWSSGPLVANQTWEWTVRESVDYYCSIHPVMKGKIIVSE
jgi:plastocyanin